MTISASWMAHGVFVLLACELTCSKGALLEMSDEGTMAREGRSTAVADIWHGELIVQQNLELYE